MLTVMNEGDFPNGTLIHIFFGLIFLTAIGTFISHLYKSLTAWSSSNLTPIQDRYGTVIAKHIRRSSGYSDDANSRSTYSVIFEFEDHNQMEFWIDGQQFNHLAEGDEGRLTFQGTQFRAFERSKEAVH